MGPLHERTEVEFPTYCTEMPATQLHWGSRCILLLLHLRFLVKLFHQWLSQMKLSEGLIWKVRVISWQLQLDFTANLACDQNVVIKTWSTISRSDLSRRSFKGSLRKLQVPPLGPSYAPRHTMIHKGPVTALASVTASSQILRVRRAAAKPLFTHAHMRCPSLTSVPSGAPKGKDNGLPYGDQGQGAGL